ncbi:MAG: pentapeptide repeat-containing protein, partial [Hoeflea sp.]
HARFDNAVIRTSDFSSIAAEDVEEPFTARDLDFLRTNMAGASFRKSVIYRADFRDIHGIAPVFDDAAVAMADFTAASIGGASFRNAMIIDTVFDNASLLSLDLEGAIVFEQTFLQQLRQVAEPGSFVAERWRLTPISAGEVAEHPRYIEMTNHVPETAYANRQAFRISQVEATGGD